MFTPQEIEDTKKKLAVLSDNYMSEIAKRANLSRSTVAKYFENNNVRTRKETAKAIFDAALAYLDEEKRKQELRKKKVDRLVYDKEEDEKKSDSNAIQGELDLKTQ